MRTILSCRLYPIPPLLHFLPLLLALAACNSSPERTAESPPVWIQTDSVVLRAPAPDLLYDGWPYVFAGRIFLKSDNTGKVYVYDTTGHFLHTLIGQRGQGPGELPNVDAIWADKNHAWAYSSDLQQMNVYDPSGKFSGQFRWSQPDTQAVHWYVNALQRSICRMNGKWYNFAHPSVGNIEQMAYYHKPLISLHDEKGRLAKAFGEWDAVYRESLLTYRAEAFPETDERRGELLLSQAAGRQIQRYDSRGNYLGAFGVPGRHVEENAWRAIPASPNTAKYHQLYKEYATGTPQYVFVSALDDYIVRSYRGPAASPDQAGYLNLPHYLQVYNRAYRLLVDAPAPDPQFWVHGKSGNGVWISKLHSYDVDLYQYTLYRYELAPAP